MDILPPCSKCSLLISRPHKELCECGRRIMTSPDAQNRQFYIGQTVNFLSKMSVVANGIIRSIVDPFHVIVGYAETWTSYKYNEIHPVNRVSTSAVELSDLMPKRRQCSHDTTIQSCKFNPVIHPQRS